ncbi:MAG TPA: hypothetical protein VMZ51_00160 [Acidimicrobiales bacterium]|nr:hypothetical protein [Acidimicrobiales bacterium]
MKRVRPKAPEADEAIAEEAPATAAPQPERRPRKSSLLSECWADLRGRPRPVAEPVWEPEPESRIETGGIGIDDVGFRRMESRYARSSSSSDRS